MTFDHATWGKHEFKKGDLVQMTRLGLSRQRKGASAAVNPKTETSSGIFIRYQGWTGITPPKHKTCVVHWFVGYRKKEKLTRVDYIEPLGTPR